MATIPISHCQGNAGDNGHKITFYAAHIISKWESGPILDRVPCFLLMFLPCLRRVFLASLCLDYLWHASTHSTNTANMAHRICKTYQKHPQCSSELSLMVTRTQR